MLRPLSNSEYRRRVKPVFGPYVDMTIHERALCIAALTVRNAVYWECHQYDRRPPSHPAGIDTMVMNNFYDSAVLNWCMLFSTSKTQKHRTATLFQKDYQRIHGDMLDCCRISEDSFIDLRKNMERLRNKIIAHKDPQVDDTHRFFLIPVMKTAGFVFDRLICMVSNYPDGLSSASRIDDLVVQWRNEGRQYYRSFGS